MITNLQPTPLRVLNLNGTRYTILVGNSDTPILTVYTKLKTSVKRAFALQNSALVVVLHGASLVTSHCSDPADYMCEFLVSFERLKFVR